VIVGDNLQHAVNDELNPHTDQQIIFALVGIILWGCLRSSGAIMRLVGKGGIEAISRLMGFLLVCMGIPKRPETDTSPGLAESYRDQA
jgi:small neutral amino acid transporter SnatA (MarC family)